MPSIRPNTPSPARRGSPSGETAGKRLGTTRIRQPAPFVTRMISGGVRSSFPGQKGQAGSRAGSGSRSTLRGSWGRAARRGAMITHSFVVGSCRSCDMFRVGYRPAPTLS